MLNYSLRQLEYLVACADAGSLAQAARVLNVSQPTISVAIAKLEAQFGTQLMLRHHAQGVTMTPAGQDILHAARRLLTEANDLQRTAMQTATTIAGTIRLGSFSTLAPIALPPLTQELTQRFPAIQLAISEGTQETLVAGLLAGTLDQALLYNIDLPNGLRQIPLASRAPHVALPEGHPLANRSAIRLSDLAPYPMILLDVAPSRGYFLGLFKTAGVVPTIAHSSPSLELVRGMVGHGLGYSILVTRPHGDRTQDGKPLVIRPLKDDIEPSQMVLASLQSLRPTRLISSFEKVAVDVLR